MHNHLFFFFYCSLFIELPNELFLHSFKCHLFTFYYHLIKLSCIQVYRKIILIFGDKSFFTPTLVKSSYRFGSFS